MKHPTTDAARAGKAAFSLQIEGHEGIDLNGAWVDSFSLPASHSLQAAWLVRLNLSTGWVLEFFSTCHQVAGWQEVGSLNVKVIPSSELADDAGWATHSIGNFQIGSIDCLIYEDDDVRTECGLVFSGVRGTTITVAAAPAPGSVSMSLPSSPPEEFEPEFESSQCRRQPWRNGA